MRKIKFRVWNETKNIMDENPYIWVSPFASITANNIFERSDETQTQDFIWMQFTGIKDKNGVDIYEGDKVKGLFNEKRNLIYSVYFHQEVLAWFLKSETNINIHLCDLSEIEVVGNIYSNKK